MIMFVACIMCRLQHALCVDFNMAYVLILTCLLSILQLLRNPQTNPSCLACIVACATHWSSQTNLTEMALALRDDVDSARQQLEAAPGKRFACRAAPA